MLDIKHLLRLKSQGRSNREIGQLLGMHRNTVNSYIKQLKSTGQEESRLMELDNSALHELLHPHKAQATARYETLSGQFLHYERELKKVGATLYILWEKYQSEHPDGYGYTQFRKHVRAYQKTQEVSLNWTHKYGDKLFLDFTGKKLPIVNKVSGEVEWKEVLVCILGGSNYTYVEAVESQRLEHFLEAVQNCFQFLGGVSQAVVPDNLKSAVTTADNYEPTVNRNFSAMALHYGTVVLPTRSLKPKDKALVEGAVKLVYQRVFYPLNNIKFYNLSDLNTAIRSQLDQHNNRPFQGREYSRRDLFDQEEKPLLSPLPSERFERRTYRKTRVNKDTHIYLDYHYYSVPNQYVDKPVLIQATSGQVEVFLQKTHERIALHHRSSQRGGFTTNPQHLPVNVRLVSNWSVEQFTDQAAEIGEKTKAFFYKIFEHKAHPEQAYKACLGILKLNKCYANKRINDACGRADYFNNYSYQAIKNILNKGLDQVHYLPHNQEDNQPQIEAAHPNIRGGKYYE